MIKNKMIGRRYDGGESPLGSRPADIGDYGAAFMHARAGGTTLPTLPLDHGVTGQAADPHVVTHPILNLTTDFVVRDLTRLAEGRFEEPFESDIVRRMIERQGLSPSDLRSLSARARAKIHDEIVRILQKQVAENGRDNSVLRGTMLDGLTLGRDDEDVQMPGGTVTTLGRIRRYLTGVGLSTEQLRRLPSTEQDRVTRRAERAIRAEKSAGRQFDGTEQRRARTALHVSLREWARGPLRLEHPQASSYHHLLEYERSCYGDSELERIRDRDPQIFVVERDWARAFAGYENLTEGTCPLPFPYCLFEFRISGVRVLAFINEGEMFMIYGRDGVWVCDDFVYDWESGAHHRESEYKDFADVVEFDRVAQLVRDNVRVACIMVDANVAARQTVLASPALVQRRRAQGKAAPRNHYVIDLKRQRRYESHRAGSGGPSGIKQPGHFRRGTWVHYDDPESGSVQYADDGGFWHSRTWRKWHFAGDPENIIEREYKL
jgi:hypothetical protein